MHLQKNIIMNICQYWSLKIYGIEILQYDNIRRIEKLTRIKIDKHNRLSVKSMVTVVWQQHQ